MAMRSGMRGFVILVVVVALAPRARAADQDTIDRAVERAAGHIKSEQQADGSWKHSANSLGATALCGLALLEADVKDIRPDDPVIQKAAKFVRERCISCTETYSLSTSIMFLDLLGDPADSQLIESMALRLMAGQDPATGGWSYNCPGLSAAEEARLKTQLQQPRLVTKELPKGSRDRRDPRDLPPEIQQQLQQVGGVQGQAGIGVSGDNSNTQFATLALWIARRQGMPVAVALKRLDGRFRATQNGDGGWGYQPPGPGAPGLAGGPLLGEGSTPTMTCAGLIGLAVSHGTAVESTLRAGGLPGTNPAPRRPSIDLNNDPTIRRGINALGNLLSVPFEGPGKGQPNAGQAAPNGAALGLGAPGQMGQNMAGKRFYFLFSLERVGVAYGLETFGGRPWYDYGCEQLLHSQSPDGAWSGEYGEACSDTCFGILFLRRANLAQDLSSLLRGAVTDRTLRAGGAGAQGLKNLPPVTTKEPSGSTPSGVSPTAPKADVPAAPRGNVPPARPAAPDPRVDPAVAQLSDELLQAPPGTQDDVLRKLRDSKGPNYTDALAYAIHQLSGPARDKAREALADRLTRMSAKTLADKLQDDDLEVRRAGALACAMKDDRTNTSKLIELLKDPQPTVSAAAHAALKALSKQSFGPEDIAAWKEWWSKNADK
jgi:hypothetical protein